MKETDSDLKNIQSSRWMLYGLILFGLIAWVLSGFKKTKYNKIKLKESEKIIGKKIENLVFEDIPKIDKKIEELKQIDDIKAIKLKNDFLVIREKMDKIIKKDNINKPLGKIINEDDELWKLT